MLLFVFMIVSGHWPYGRKLRYGNCFEFHLRINSYSWNIILHRYPIYDYVLKSSVLTTFYNYILYPCHIWNRLLNKNPQDITQCQIHVITVFF